MTSSGSDKAGPCFGIVAEDTLQLHRLRGAIADFGCDVLTLSPQAFALKSIEEYTVNAWLVDLREDDDLLDATQFSVRPTLAFPDVRCPK